MANGLSSEYNKAVDDFSKRLDAELSRKSGREQYKIANDLLVNIDYLSNPSNFFAKFAAELPVKYKDDDQFVSDVYKNPSFQESIKRSLPNKEDQDAIAEKCNEISKATQEKPSVANATPEQGMIPEELGASKEGISPKEKKELSPETPGAETANPEEFGEDGELAGGNAAESESAAETKDAAGGKLTESAKTAEEASTGGASSAGAGEAAGGLAKAGAAGGGEAVAAAGAAGAGEAAVGGGVAAAGVEFGLPILIIVVGVVIFIILIIVAVFFWGKIGKSGSYPSNPYTNKGSIDTIVANKTTQYNNLFKNDLDAFIKDIEAQKAAAEKTNKPNQTLIDVCNKLIEKANKLKEINGKIKLKNDEIEAKDRDAQATLKGDKAKLEIEIMDLIKQMVPLLYSCDSYPLKNGTLSQSGVMFYELPRPDEGGFPKYIPYSSASSQYGTAEFICLLGSTINIYNNSMQAKYSDFGKNDKYIIQIGDLSNSSGTQLGTHKSHQKGMDADIYIPGGMLSYSNYQQSIARLFIQSYRQAAGKIPVTIFYDDPQLESEKLSYVIGGHANHFHVRDCNTYPASLCP